MSKKMKDIDHALVEVTRPPIYTAMKYWGKKPHNIWREYIETYTEPGMTILDPFSGSAVAALEAVKIGRKAIAFDLNPLTSFILEVYATEFDYESFKCELDRIVDMVKKDPVYKHNYNYDSNKVIQHFKWNNGTIYEFGIMDPDTKNREIKYDCVEVNLKALEIEDINNEKWYPNHNFDDNMDVSRSFIKMIGGKSFDKLWTKRNLYVLSLIFDGIQHTKKPEIQKQLMYGFIQIVHLSSKMCVPRNDKSNRSFSTSWGRSAYICSSRQMEMNPLLLFLNNCLGKQSVESSLESVVGYLGKIPKIKKISKNNKVDFRQKDIDIFYGIVDVKEIEKYVEAKSVDFIITDPPYGGLVQYLDLSQIWLIWLEKFDESLKTDRSEEITIKAGIKDLDQYELDFRNGVKQLKRVLKDQSKIVFTFHNKDIKIWNSFLKSIDNAGFIIEKLLHQENKRSGESSVSNPYGTSSSDFYIRCIKRNKSKKNPDIDSGDFDSYILDSITQVILDRGEPTPYQIIFDKTIVIGSKIGVSLEYIETRVKQIMDFYKGKIFEVVEDPITHEMNWYILDENNFNFKEKDLTSRVENAVRNYLYENKSVTFDQVLGSVFLQFPNGLTPSTKKVEYYLKKYAKKMQGKWIYNER